MIRDSLHVETIKLLKEEAVETIKKTIEERIQNFKTSNARKYFELLNPQTTQDKINYTTDLKNDAPAVIAQTQIPEATKEQISNALKQFIPWRKGPFQIFHEYIDSEWRSDLKWNRLKSHLPSLKDKRVLDVGCNNGYYMFRMAEQAPKMVLGIDPVAKYMCNFEYLNSWFQISSLIFEPLKIQEMVNFKSTFDVIFLMGILYHHRDPIGILEIAKKTLVRGGALVLETMGVGLQEDISITPKQRYARMKNIWFVPTQSTLEIWLTRAGFQNIKFIYNEPLTTDEQRSTPWAPFDSFENFLEVNDSSKTEEGYPAPHRIYCVAK